MLLRNVQGPVVVDMVVITVAAVAEETGGKKEQLVRTPTFIKLEPGVAHYFRFIIPAYPAFNIYSHIASTTTALGPVCVATIVDRMDSWSAEIIDENSFHRNSLRLPDGSVDHRSLQSLRKADVVGFYGGLTSTIPRLYSIAKICKEMGIVTIAGGQHFNDETLQEALNSGIDVVVLGEGEVTISELLAALIPESHLKR